MTFRILLIDDSALSRRVVRDIAEELPGVTVIGEAVNGQQGIDMMESLKPDLAILDVEMPVLNGLQVLE
ncbi:MAG: response regulator, partial [Leptonema sp. (in: Bacteria)]|nr:response regulator [Leptonema sp. (in: bacteria)]